MKKTLVLKKFLTLKKWIEYIQTRGYNGTRIIDRNVQSQIFSCDIRCLLSLPGM